MSTRALYTFKDEDSAWNVYKHHDGYPRGAANTIENALKHFAWKLPRFEADEFAAAFCAAGKAHRMILLAEGKETPEEYAHNEELYTPFGHGGGVRFMPQGKPRDVAQSNCSDIEYRYEITAKSTLHVKAYTVSCGWGDGSKYTEKLIYNGTLEGFIEFANKKDEAA